MRIKKGHVEAESRGHAGFWSTVLRSTVQGTSPLLDKEERTNSKLRRGLLTQRLHGIS
jgi:hypothetical protein